MIQQTSIKAFESIQKSLGDRQKKVYLALCDLQAANNLILARRLGLPINQVTPRVLELRKLGLVIKDSMRPCPITKRITWFWRVRVNNENNKRTLEFEQEIDSQKFAFSTGNEGHNIRQIDPIKKLTSSGEKKVKEVSIE